MSMVAVVAVVAAIANVNVYANVCIGWLDWKCVRAYLKYIMCLSKTVEIANHVLKLHTVPQEDVRCNGYSIAIHGFSLFRFRKF